MLTGRTNLFNISKSHSRSERLLMRNITVISHIGISQADSTRSRHVVHQSSKKTQQTFAIMTLWLRVPWIRIYDSRIVTSDTADNTTHAHNILKM